MIRSIESSSLTRIQTRVARPSAASWRGFDARRIGVRAGVGHVVDAHVEVARRALRAVVELEVLARDDAMEHPGRAGLDLPAEHGRVELGRRLGVGRREVDEDQGVRIRHGDNIAQRSDGQTIRPGTGSVAYDGGGARPPSACPANRRQPTPTAGDIHDMSITERSNDSRLGFEPVVRETLERADPGAAAAPNHRRHARPRRSRPVRTRYDRAVRRRTHLGPRGDAGLDLDGRDRTARQPLVRGGAPSRRQLRRDRRPQGVRAPAVRDPSVARVTDDRPRRRAGDA